MMSYSRGDRLLQPTHFEQLISCPLATNVGTIQGPVWICPGRPATQALYNFGALSSMVPGGTNRLRHITQTRDFPGSLHSTRLVTWPQIAGAAVGSAARMEWKWCRYAACRSRTELDWIDAAGDAVDQCRDVCAACPVINECLTAALVNGEPWGIWGGLDEHQRAAVALATDMAPPRVIPGHGTNARYVKHGCRCQVCRAAHSAYERERRARIAFRQGPRWDPAA